MKEIATWRGSTGGSEETLPSLAEKCRENFSELFRSVSSPENFAIFDDFDGDVIKDQWSSTAGSDSPAAAAALVESVDGLCAMVTGDSNASLAADGVIFTSFLNWKVDKGLVFEAKVKVSAITNVQLFVGLTDRRDAIEMPVTLSTVTYSTVATDAVGFLFDTAATTDTIRCVSVANDVDGTHVDSGLAYVADTFKILRIEIDRTFNAYFYIDGVLVGTILAAMRAAIPLAICICARAAGDTTPKTVSWDYIGAARPRI
jgi:hypothetical protein